MQWKQERPAEKEEEVPVIFDDKGESDQYTGDSDEEEEDRDGAWKR